MTSPLLLGYKNMLLLQDGTHEIQIEVVTICLILFKAHMNQSEESRDQ